MTITFPVIGRTQIEQSHLSWDGTHIQICRQVDHLRSQFSSARYMYQSLLGRQRQCGMRSE